MALHNIGLNIAIFMQSGFNSSNGVTDTLKSSSMVIYFSMHMSFYTRNVGRMPQRLKIDEHGAAEVVN
jgi:hypothetical protein